MHGSCAERKNRKRLIVDRATCLVETALLHRVVCEWLRRVRVGAECSRGPYVAVDVGTLRRGGTVAAIGSQG
jgi:hypothetical protein